MPNFGSICDLIIIDLPEAGCKKKKVIELQRAIVSELLCV
jgi:hypothetical protein